jgi:hypothetical protein
LFDPFFYVLKKFLRPEKIFSPQGIIKKIIDTAKNFEKIILHAGNGPPITPPPPTLF